MQADTWVLLQPGFDIGVFVGGVVTDHDVQVTAGVAPLAGLGSLVASTLPTQLSPQALAASGPYLYWADQGGSIGRARLDGTGVQPNFIPNLGGNPCGVALADGYIYWGEDQGDAVGRADLDGAHANPNFLQVGNSSCLGAVSGGYIYWASNGNGGSTGGIGRAKLNGTDIDTNFINDPEAGAVFAYRGYLYWGNVDISGVAATLGRATLNGAGVDQDFITGVSNVGVSMAVGPKYIYWGDGGATLQGGTAVGRADIDGTNVNRHFLTAPASSGIAVYGNELYYASGLSGAGTIGRVNLDGAQSQPNFIHVAGEAFGLAIGPG